MPVTKNIDLKLQFEPYDCTPGPTARMFLRKVLQHGAKTDDQGWSLHDTFMRQDDGAVQNGTGIGIPGTPNHVARVASPLATAIVAPVAGGAAAQAAHNAQLNARKKRLKDSAAFILMHLDDESTTLLLEDSQGACRYSQNGPEIYDYIVQHCVTPYSTTELHEMKAALMQVSILHTVGMTQNSVKDLQVLQRLAKPKRLSCKSEAHPFQSRSRDLHPEDLANSGRIPVAIILLPDQPELRWVQRSLES